MSSNMHSFFWSSTRTQINCRLPQTMHRSWTIASRDALFSFSRQLTRTVVQVQDSRRQRSSLSMSLTSLQTFLMICYDSLLQNKLSAFSSWLPPQHCRYSLNLLRRTPRFLSCLSSTLIQVLFSLTCVPSPAITTIFDCRSYGKLVSTCSRGLFARTTTNLPSNLETYFSFFIIYFGCWDFSITLRSTMNRPVCRSLIALSSSARLTGGTSRSLLGDKISSCCCISYRRNQMASFPSSFIVRFNLSLMWFCKCKCYSEPIAPPPTTSKNCFMSLT